MWLTKLLVYPSFSADELNVLRGRCSCSERCLIEKKERHPLWRSLRMQAVVARREVEPLRLFPSSSSARGENC